MAASLHPASLRSKAQEDATLRESVAVVVEVIGFAINALLYQRAVYPPESFALVRKFGLPMPVTNHPAVKAYLGRQLAQIANWALLGLVERVVVVLEQEGVGRDEEGHNSGRRCRVPVERWSFAIDSSAALRPRASSLRPSEDLAPDVQALFRQLAASVSHLPELEGPLTFDVLVYTTSECNIPPSWEVSDGRPLLPTSADGDTGPDAFAAPAEVRLRSFSTNLHRVDVSAAFVEKLY